MSDNLVKSAIEVAARMQEGTLQGVLVSEVDLSKNGIAGAHAADATFRRIALHDADASNSLFSRSKFTEASCRKARFDHSVFRGSSFFNCELIEARFNDGMIQGTSFFSSRLGNADFSGCRIQSSTFNSCELFGARFPRALIMNTKFEAQERGNVTLDRADFSNSVIIDCDLMGANLFGANFQNALLVKVDLRHANIAQANFEGAHLVDVQVDMTQLEPAERRMLERAKLDDPWRSHGFMKEILAPYANEELAAMFEYLLRTYVIETAEPTNDADSFVGLIQTVKARHDFPELEHLRIRNGVIQVRMGVGWHELGQPIEGLVDSDDDSPPSRPRAPMVPAQPAEASAKRERGPHTIDDEPRAAARKEQGPPPKVATSKRFRKLELD
jgi:uncharacterized protein YjbI with pentapeptide repeats